MLDKCTDPFWRSSTNTHIHVHAHSCTQCPRQKAPGRRRWELTFVTSSINFSIFLLRNREFQQGVRQWHGGSVSSTLGATSRVFFLFTAAPPPTSQNPPQEVVLAPGAQLFSFPLPSEPPPSDVPSLLCSLSHRSTHPPLALCIGFLLHLSPLLRWVSAPSHPNVHPCQVFPPSCRLPI